MGTLLLRSVRYIHCKVRFFYSPASPLPLNVTQVCAELVVLVLQVVVSSGIIVVYLACGLYCLCSGPQDGRMGLD